MTPLPKTQRETMREIYRMTVNSSYASVFRKPTADDLVASLATLGSLQTKGLIKSAREPGTHGFPRHAIVWSLTDEGKKWCEENLGE